MKLPERIEVNPEIMMGKPCIEGTRIPVDVLLQKIAAGETEAQLLEAYPQLSKADSRQSWNTPRARLPRKLPADRPAVSRARRSIRLEASLRTH